MPRRFPRYGASMGITALIPDMTIGQLTTEAVSRWGEIWDEKAARMLILLMCPRKERKIMELHGDMVEHGQPVLTVFHRPRQEAQLLEKQGFNPRDASFQFVDLSSPDLGPWMQHLITNEHWLRSSIEIVSVPFSMNLPSQRSFETQRILCFRHPSLPALEKYYLPFPPNSIPGKCFVSLPRRQAAELARQQAEVLGVGRLEKKPTITEIPASQKPTPIVTSEAADPAANMDDVMDGFSSNMLAEMTIDAELQEQENVALPPSTSPVEEQKPVAEHAFIPLPPEAAPKQDNIPEPVEETPDESAMIPASESIPIPEVEPEQEPEMSEIEKEFRELVTGLLAAGVQPSDMMDDPRWDNITERASAAGFETWPVFLELAAME